jgi:hypothetical protein
MCWETGERLRPFYEAVGKFLLAASDGGLLRRSVSEMNQKTKWDGCVACKLLCKSHEFKANIERSL